MAAILKIIFGHNSAADCPITVEFCLRKKFFTEFRQWTDTHVPQNVLFCFLNAVWAKNAIFSKTKQFGERPLSYHL